MKHKKAESLLTEGVSAFYFLSIHFTTSCIYTSVYSQLVAITMYAIFHKIITNFFYFSFKLYAISHKIIHLSKV